MTQSVKGTSMKTVYRMVVGILAGITVFAAGTLVAQDWPQWRGPNRDAKASGFTAPTTWPEQLTQKWKVAVGDGVSTPALVGGKLYVFARQDGQEVMRCLDAATGQELWQNAYEAAAVKPPASSFSGPRSSPTVVHGKVVTLGVQGTLSCLDAESGKLLWRKDEARGGIPRFATASSTLIVDGLCIAQLGSEQDGAIVAYNLETGAEKWTWKGDGPAYGSPILVTINGSEIIVAPTSQNMVALAIADGKPLWKIPYTQGRYNAATPIVEGQTLIYAGPERGITAEQLVMEGDQLQAKPLWSNSDNSVQFNTPVVKAGELYGLSTMNNLFCINVANGKTAWSSTLTGEAAKQAPPAQEGGRGGGGRRGGMRRGGGGGGGYGSVVDAGSVLLALTPAGELYVFEPSANEYTLRAKYKVAAEKTYAYPIASGTAVYIKDVDSVTMWTTQ